MVKLSSREKEVLRMIGEHKTSKHIAQQLDLSPRTIQFYLDQIYGKLKVSGPKARYQAYNIALTHKMLD
jgi:DNA-binding NarL/FixJ family response regulator